MKAASLPILIFCVVVTGCRGKGKPVASPTDELTVTIESEHFIYHMSPGDEVDTTWQEAFYRWVCPALAVAVPERLQYFKYRDRDQIFRLTGRQTNDIQNTPKEDTPTKV